MVEREGQRRKSVARKSDLLNPGDTMLLQDPTCQGPAW